MAIAPGVLFGIGAAFAAASTAFSVMSSQEQAAAVDAMNRRNAENASRVAAANKAIAEQEALDRGAVLSRQADAYAAVIRTNSETRGTLGSTNASDMERAVYQRTSLEQARINQQLDATKTAITAGSSPQFIPRGSAALDAFGGALNGLQTGLSLYGSLSSLNAAQGQLGMVQSSSGVPSSPSSSPFSGITF